MFPAGDSANGMWSGRNPEIGIPKEKALSRNSGHFPEEQASGILKGSKLQSLLPTCSCLLSFLKKRRNKAAGGMICLLPALEGALGYTRTLRYH